MIQIFLTIIYLTIQSFFDLKTRNVSNKLSWALIFVSIGLMAYFSLFNPIVFLEWVLGMGVVGIFFWKIKKWFPSQFGSGDFWGILTIQALNPSIPFILVSIPIYATATILGFIYSLKKGNEIPFFPFLLGSSIFWLLIIGSYYF